MKDIDLIDRYLNNELDEQQQQVFKDRYLNDPEFKKEVEVYRKIYEGVEKATRYSLKQRLEAYYNEYLSEDLSIEEDAKIIAINKWRGATRLIAGIAASLLLAAVGVWYFTLKNAATNQQIARAREKIKIDSTGGPGKYAGTRDHPTTTTVKKKPATLPVNKGGQYSLTGGEKVNTVQVLAVAQAPMTYTFKDGILSIYNNPTLGLIRLHIFKTKDRYHLWYDGDVYKLSQTTSNTRLIKAGQSEDFGIKTAETVKVQVEPLQASGYPCDNPVVRLQRAGERKYFFRKEKDKLILELQGDFVASDCKVIDVKTVDKNTFYLLDHSSVYPLDEQMGEPTVLNELSGMASEKARQFLKRDPVTVPVFVRR